jgi:hypothetical protein
VSEPEAFEEEHRIAITKRLEGLETIARLMAEGPDNRSLELYGTARALHGDIEELYGRYVPAPGYNSGAVLRIRKHLSALAGLDEYHLPEGHRGHLVHVLADLKRLRDALDSELITDSNKR